MDDFKRLDKLITSIKKEILSLKKGELQISDFEKIFQESRELYERLTVIRYQVISSQDSTQEVEKKEEKASNFEEPLNFSLGDEIAEEEEVEVRQEESIEKTISKPEEENQISLIDAIKEEEKSINEQIAASGQTATLNDVLANVEQELKTVSERIVEGKLVDINEAVEINEKYLFINDLFEADNEAYREAINTLNACGNREEADYFIEKELKTQYNWPEESETVAQFLKIIERRFD